MKKKKIQLSKNWEKRFEISAKFQQVSKHLSVIFAKSVVFFNFTLFSTIYLNLDFSLLFLNHSKDVIWIMKN